MASFHIFERPGGTVREPRGMTRTLAMDWGGAAVFGRGAVPKTNEHGTGGWDMRGSNKDVFVRKDNDAAD